MLEKLKAVEHRLTEVEHQLSDPTVYTDRERLTALSREQKELTPLVTCYRAYARAARTAEDAAVMLADPELRELAQEELSAARGDMERLTEELKRLLLPKDPNDEKNVILEIRAGIGGEEGALKGPSMMPGGSPVAWPYVKPIFQAICAKVEDGSPCCEWVGENGAGHFVKMVHNGIEYGDMQLIAEAYSLLKGGLNLTNEELAQTFTEWNNGELSSYLIDITKDIFTKKDEDGNYLVDVILDEAANKGTGKWTSQSALDLGEPLSLITESVFARYISSLKDQRVAASKVLSGPQAQPAGDKAEFIEKVRRALYLGKIVSYAQGFSQLRAASEEYNWDLNYGEIAKIFRAGCIIRAQFLQKITDAYAEDPQIANLLLAPYFKQIADDYQQALRDVVAYAVQNGIPVPTFAAAVAYYDSYRAAVLPANLIQAQRDYFGAHTYKRIDKEGVFHTEWLD